MEIHFEKPNKYCKKCGWELLPDLGNECACGYTPDHDNYSEESSA